jgi:hypothetical protein
LTLKNNVIPGRWRWRAPCLGGGAGEDVNTVESAIPRWGVLALALSALPGAAAFGAGRARSDNRPLSSFLTLDQTKKLLVHYASGDCQVSQLWRYRARQRDGIRQQIFVAGSYVRGLLHHFHREAQRGKTFAQIKRMSGPCWERYLPKGTSGDLDVVLPDRLVKSDNLGIDLPRGLSQLSRLHAEEKADILHHSFYRASHQYGGPTLQQIAVSPESVIDPLGGLEAFWQGRLEYKPITRGERRRLDRKFSADDRIGIQFTYLGEVLRLVRYQLEHPSLRIGASGRRAIAELLQRGEPAYTVDQQRKNLKAVERLFELSGGDRVQTMVRLKQYGLLDHLSQQGCVGFSRRTYDDEPADYIAASFRRGLTLRETRMHLCTAWPPVNEGPLQRFMDALLKKVRTRADFQALVGHADSRYYHPFLRKYYRGDAVWRKLQRIGPDTTWIASLKERAPLFYRANAKKLSSLAVPAR